MVVEARSSLIQYASSSPNNSDLNYQKMCDEYYHILEEKQTHKDINAGAVVHKKMTDDILDRFQAPDNREQRTKVKSHSVGMGR